MYLRDMSRSFKKTPFKGFKGAFKNGNFQPAVDKSRMPWLEKNKEEHKIEDKSKDKDKEKIN